MCEHPSSDRQVHICCQGCRPGLPFRWLPSWAAATSCIRTKYQLPFAHAQSLTRFCAFCLSVQEAEEERLREEFAKQGILIPKKERSEIFDSNTITPGTPFMHRLSIALQYYVHLKINIDPGWRDIEVRAMWHDSQQVVSAV